MPPRDQSVAVEHIESLSEGHQGHAELKGQLPLVVEPGPWSEPTAKDSLAERLSDLVVARHPGLHMGPFLTLVF